MIIVKTTVKPSSVNGLGLFAGEKILKGTVVWRYDPLFDISFSPEEVEKMNLDQRELIERYAYLSTEQNVYIYSIDNSRFMNHSASHKNVDTVALPGDIETSAVANRDIEEGEEILVDYRSFDAHDAVSDEEYLNT